MAMCQGDPHDSSDEEWDHEMVRCTHYPPIFDEHGLDTDVDMANLVATGFAHAPHEEGAEDEGHEEEETDGGAHGGLLPDEEDADMVVEEQCEDRPDDTDYDTDDMDVYGVHTGGSPIGDDSVESVEEDVAAMASESEQRKRDFLAWLDSVVKRTCFKTRLRAHPSLQDQDYPGWLPQYSL